MAGISGRKAPKKWLWMRNPSRCSECNQLSKTKITCNCCFFGINNSFFIRLADLCSIAPPRFLACLCDSRRKTWQQAKTRAESRADKQTLFPNRFRFILTSPRTKITSPGSAYEVCKVRSGCCARFGAGCLCNLTAVITKPYKPFSRLICPFTRQ